MELDKQPYEKVLRYQHGLVKMREQGIARDTIITVEHPHVITVGKDGHEENYSDLKTVPIKVERGGDVTYHGPGQLVIYFIFNLARRGRDLHRFMVQIQEGIIKTLKSYNISGSRGDKFIGVWVGKKKIASVGIAVKKWISFHGAAVNLNTDLTQFESIHPCGLQSSTMVSAGSLIGKHIEMKTFAKKLVDNYAKIFKIDFCPVSLEELAEDIESQSGGGHV